VYNAFIFNHRSHLSFSTLLLSFLFPFEAGKIGLKITG